MKLVNSMIKFHIVWWCIMCIIFVSEAMFDSIDLQEKYAFATAVCKAKCYSKYSEKQVTANDFVLAKCSRRNKSCVTCTKVCEDILIFRQEPDCDLFCTHMPEYAPSKTSCIESCNSIYHLMDYGKTWGSCPISKEDNPRVNFCRGDWDCPLSSRCCRTSASSPANKHCISPVISLNDVPTKLQTSTIGKHSAKLSWSMTKGKYLQFVIEKKVAENKDYLFAMPWEYVGQTSTLKLQIDYIRSKATYYFRVAAVGEDGFHGYSNHTVFTLPKPKIVRPSKPLVFKVRESEGSEKLVISWKKPEKIVGKLMKYKLVYYKVPEMYSKEIAYENKRIISASQTEVIIDGFMPNTKYQFILFAVVKVGGHMIRGKKAKTRYETGNFKPLSLTRRDLLSAEIGMITFPPVQQTQQIKILSSKLLNKTMFTLQWQVLDKLVNTVELKWNSFNCQNELFVEHSHQTMPSRWKNFSLNNLHEKCYYKVRVRPLYYYGKHGREMILQFHTYPERFKSSCTSKLSILSYLYSLVLVSLCSSLL